MITITINVKNIAQIDLKKMCVPTDTPYQKSSKYIAYLTRNFCTILETQGFKPYLTESATLKATLLYTNEKKQIRKIIQHLTPDNSIASVSIECLDRNELATVEASLKFLKVPNEAIKLE